ncbi:MAG: DNA mismatch repair endonuclease MutL [Puniceicoccales bacterium]|jgi:DNA mismatch repair protein MutL|nr:DNA mismatch repair endonuclease MutL [Puniceicoccales bacterium]
MLHNKIAILSDSVVNKIAAGEIIERPAAVVKELVENSLDAGSKHIDVRFSRGGKFLIAVEDDGRGMARDEALLAIKRHATSKLHDVQDLNSLSTFGFRGEALPSIASVSKFRLLTCCNSDTCGTEITLSGGKDAEVRDCAKFCGTKIIVENLFYNVPARRKFLKSDETESAHIISLLKNLALAEIGVKFSLSQNGNEIFHSPDSAKLGERVNEIFKCNEKFIDFSYGDGIASIKGTVCDPTFGNVCRKNILSFVNGRLVRNDLINAALNEELSPIFPAHRGILIYIFLRLDPKSIDVNVHPMKREVRFKNEMAVRTLIRDCMAEVFESKMQRKMEKSLPAPTEFSARQSLVCNPFAGHGITTLRSSLQNIFPRREIPIAEQKALAPHFSANQNNCQWKFVGLTFGELAIFECETGIIIFSIRLAANRIIYEKIMAGDDASNCSQQLLIPIEFSLKQDEMERFKQFLPIFSRHGFSIYSFGQCDYKIDATPEWMCHRDAEIIIRELVSGGEDCYKNSTSSIEKIFAKCLAKAANIENYKTQDSVENLRDKLLSCNNPLLCPAGNATFFEIPFCEINNRFHPKKN